VPPSVSSPPAGRSSIASADPSVCSKNRLTLHAVHHARHVLALVMVKPMSRQTFFMSAPALTWSSTLCPPAAQHVGGVGHEVGQRVAVQSVA